MSAMGAVIEAVATARHRTGRAPSSTALAVEAARRTLTAAERRPDSVDLLVNASVYRDASVMEPANAAFVQRDLEGDASFTSVKGSRTLSFDLSNGACGMIDGLQVLDGFVASGAAQHGLVVTADVDPTPGVSEGYRYEPMGAAVLVGPGRPDEGFEAFAQRTYPQYADLHTATISWSGSAHVVAVREDPSFRARCEECIDDALASFLADRGLRPADVDLVVAWPAPRDLGLRSGLRADQVADLGPISAPVHTAGIGLAMEAAAASPRYRAASRVLFVAAGSGITVAIASYRRPAR